MEKRSTQVVSCLLLNIPISVVLCAFGQMLSVWEGDAPAFSMTAFWISLPVSYALATLIGLFIPCVPLGMAFTRRCGAKPGSLKFALLINVVINSIYTVILSFAMTFLNARILNGAPMIAVVFGFLRNVIPIWLVCYLVSFLAGPPCRKLAAKLGNL